MINFFKPAYDTSTLALLRSVLDEILVDQKFLEARSVSSLEIAEQLLSLASDGDRDAERLKASILESLSGKAA